MGGRGYRVLSVIGLNLSWVVVLPGALVIDGCKMKFQINSRDILMRAEVCEGGREGVVHKVSVRNIYIFFCYTELFHVYQKTSRFNSVLCSCMCFYVWFLQRVRTPFKAVILLVTFIHSLCAFSGCICQSGAVSLVVYITCNMVTTSAWGIIDTLWHLPVGLPIHGSFSVFG